MDFNQSMYNYMINRSSYLSDKNKMISFYGKDIDRKTFIDEVEKISSFLQHLGIEKGDNVVICLGNIPNAIISFYAVNKIGAIANLLHPLVKNETLQKINNEMKPKCFIMFDEFYNNYPIFKDIDTPVILCSALDYLLKPFVPFYALWTRKYKKGIKYSNKLIKYSSIEKCDGKSVEVNGDDVAIYMHSSGTTGESKTSVLTNEAYNHVADNLINAAYGGVQTTDKQGMLMALPIFHTFGLGVCVHTSLCYGTQSILVPKFNPTYVAFLMHIKPVSIIPCVPNMLRKLSKNILFKGKCLNKIVDVFCGGDKLPDDVKQNFENRCKKYGSNLKIAEGYGLTECGVCLINLQHSYKEGSIGKPLPGSKFIVLDENKNRLKVNEIGNLYISTNSMMKGYFKENNDVFTYIEGEKYFNTGDMGYMDKDNNVFFVDREKRLIKISGNNVFPQEIENIVNKIDKVNISCAVCFYEQGKPQIRLYVELKTGEELTQELKNEILNKINGSELKYSTPKEIVKIDKMPLNQIGKVDFKKLM